MDKWMCKECNKEFYAPKEYRKDVDFCPYCDHASLFCDSRGGSRGMEWEDMRKTLKSLSEEDKNLHDRMAEAVEKGWLTEEQAWWVLFGEYADV